MFLQALFSPAIFICHHKLYASACMRPAQKKALEIQDGAFQNTPIIHREQMLDACAVNFRHS
jgi:hypothetical protein